MVFKHSLSRSHTHTRTQGVCVHSTPSVQPPHSSLKEIIQSAGGELLLMPELRTRFGRKLERVTPGQLLVISTPEDISHGYCSDFIKNGICEQLYTFEVLYVCVTYYHTSTYECMFVVAVLLIIILLLSCQLSWI